jgi:hypothetical protein
MSLDHCQQCCCCERGFVLGFIRKRQTRKCDPILRYTSWSTGMLFSNLHGLKLFIVSGTSSKSWIVDIAATWRNLDEDVCLTLSGLHAISCCDSVSSLSGKGIPKVFEPVSKNPNFHKFCRVGDSLTYQSTFSSM